MQEKYFLKIQYHFYLNPLETKNRKEFPELDKEHQLKAATDIILRNSDKLNTFPLRSGTKISSSVLLFNI